MGGNNVSRGPKSGAFSVMGDYPAIAYIQSLIISQGRFINDLDLKDKRKVAVIGKRVQDVLFEPGEDPIGQEVMIQGVYFMVVGIFKSRQSGDRADRDEQTIFIPFTTFQHAFNYGNVVGWFAITSVDKIPASVAEEKVLKLLAQRHKVSPEDDRAFGHWNMEKEYNKISGVFSIISLIVWFVGIGTLLAGVIGVSNIMLIIIRERTSEIGIRRAIGATPASIVSQIVMEAAVLTTAAGIFGLALGTALLEIASGVIASMPDSGMFTNPEVDLKVGMIALVVLVISGALAGVLPAYRAVNISTVDAIRAE
jgi:putative ABC transport system permease protein